jgi:NAD(P)-dependent dehydrogenase (short-subunit alcohol dehydrogenase family)
MLFSISDKVVVLIGGAGLLGRAFARSTGSHGAITVIADVDATRTDEARDETAQAVPEGRFET